MSFVNFSKKEINFKIVYYGPARSGKTTNLERIHAMMPDDVKGSLAMLSTQEDRTLYFDFLPLKSNAIPGFTSRFQIYTVPGQPIYDKTRQLVLIGADGVVFVADSQWDKMEENVNSFEDLKNNLRIHKTSMEVLPYVVQFNKRDLPSVAPIYYLNFLMNQGDTRTVCINGVAAKGVGVDVTLNMICKMVMAKFIQDNHLAAGRIESKDIAVVESGKPNGE